MIAEFLSAQKDLLAQAEERLEQYQDKMDRQDLRGLVNSYHARLFAGIRVWERSWTPTLPPFLISRSCRQPLASHPCQALETCSQWSDLHKVMLCLHSQVLSLYPVLQACSLSICEFILWSIHEALMANTDLEHLANDCLISKWLTMWSITCLSKLRSIGSVKIERGFCWNTCYLIHISWFSSSWFIWRQ